MFRSLFSHLEKFLACFYWVYLIKVTKTSCPHLENIEFFYHYTVLNIYLTESKKFKETILNGIAPMGNNTVPSTIEHKKVKSVLAKIGNTSSCHIQVRQVAIIVVLAYKRQLTLRCILWSSPDWSRRSIWSRMDWWRPLWPPGAAAHPQTISPKSQIYLYCIYTVF